MFPFRKRSETGAADAAGNGDSGVSRATRADELWRQGSRLLDQKKPAAALAAMRDAFELEPSRLEGRLNLAVALYMTKHAEEAIPHLKYVLAFEPQNTSALLNLAACYDALGDMDNSIATLEKIVLERPNWKDAHYNLAVAYCKHNLFDEAEAALKLELQLNPQHEAARTLLNQIYLKPRKK